MNNFKQLMFLGGMGFWLLAACATPPQPFHYQPDNELKPGPGIFTGEEGAFTIYGHPPAAPEETDPSGEEPLMEPDSPKAP